MMLPYALKENEVLAVQFKEDNLFDILNAFRGDQYKVEYIQFNLNEHPIMFTDQGPIMSLHIEYRVKGSLARGKALLKKGDWLVDIGTGIEVMSNETFTGSFMRMP